MDRAAAVPENAAARGRTGLAGITKRQAANSKGNLNLPWWQDDAETCLFLPLF